MYIFETNCVRFELCPTQLYSHGESMLTIFSYMYVTLNFKLKLKL